ncbi:hypothetical protein [Fodinicola acaciae]|uniref:hypothetical protein n=1 Tax=Fodinicola acaciae TaxID=2681555 RepID=UPI0013D580A8|nr:hypothetical protein [Fodinicola acaciae]
MTCSAIPIYRMCDEKTRRVFIDAAFTKLWIDIDPEHKMSTVAEDELAAPFAPLINETRRITHPRGRPSPR